MNNSEKIAVSTLIYRKYILTLYFLVVLMWTTGGSFVWTATLKPVISNISMPYKMIIIMPFGILTWPAQQVSLCFAGKGAGSNALLPFSISTLGTFFVWSCILWLPLMMLKWRKMPFLLSIASQILMLLLIFVTFWLFGNG